MNKVVGLIRYIIIFFLAYLLFLKQPFTFIKLILFLLYILNSQIRFFILEKEKHIKISLFISILFAFYFNTLASDYTYLYLIEVMIDSAFLLSGVSSLVLLLYPLLYVLMKILYPSELFNNTIFMCCLILFLSFLKEKNDKNKEMEEEIYELKIIKDKMSDDKKRAEQYNKNMEEYTLLKERNRISREMHDHVGHTLSTLSIQLGAIEKSIDKNPKHAKEMVRGLRTYTNDSLKNVRLYLQELKPKEAEDYEGLMLFEHLLHNFEEMTKIEVHFNISKKVWKLTGDKDIVLYHILKETLSNCTKHAGCSKINITFNYGCNELIVTTKDNGKGCPSFVEGMGLKGIKSRLKQIGGYAEFSSKASDGFFTKISIPKKDFLFIRDGGNDEKN